MLAASLGGIFVIAMLYVSFQSTREWTKARFGGGKTGKPGGETHGPGQAEQPPSFEPPKQVRAAPERAKEDAD